MAMCAVTVSALIAAAAIGYRHMSATALDAYAVWWVADIVVEYLDTHERRWPQDWDDLRPSFASVCAKVGNAPWRFEELCDRVEIDFSADPKQLEKAPVVEGQPPFRVVYLRSGHKVHYEGAEPNTIIWKYLNGRWKPGDVRSLASPGQRSVAEEQQNDRGDDN